MHPNIGLDQMARTSLCPAMVGTQLVYTFEAAGNATDTGFQSAHEPKSDTY